VAEALSVNVLPVEFQCAAVCNTGLGTPSQRAQVYLLAAFESFASALGLTTVESAVCLRRSLSDEPEVF
jgi:hypothetical protein